MDEQKDLQNNTPLESNTPLDPLPEVDIPTLRTYKGDISGTVQKDKITSAKILMSEQRLRDKREAIESETSITKPKNTLALIFGVFFGLAAIGILGFFGYTKVINTKPIVEIVSETFFVFAFDNKELIDAEEQKITIYQKVKDILADSVNQKDNTYTDIIFYKTNIETEQNERITSAQFFTLYDIRLPLDIAKSISKDFVYGIYKTDGRSEPFLIIGLADYENAFDSMFDWEDSLASDLEPFFPNIQKIFNPSTNIPPQTTVETASTSTVQVASTTDATSTTTDSVNVPAPSAVSRKIEFTDVVFSNKDTRAARDANGNPFFYYAFIERDKILFAQDPKLVGEVIRKVKEKQLIR